jgi:hypothetical protein
MGCPCQPYIPKRQQENAFRRRLFYIVQHATFEGISLLGQVCMLVGLLWVVQGSLMGDVGISLREQVCSIVFLCLGGFKQSSWQGDIEKIALNFFATLIGSEITLRLFALHPDRYFNSGMPNEP